jgi:DNA-binding FadR family transcriptional regulator
MPVSSEPLSGVPMWRPVRGGNAFEITVARLAQAIRLGLVPVGERLPPERELAERLQVSRVTLREAIAALREAGFLESRRGRSGGTFVVRATGDGFEPGRGANPVQDAAALAREMGDALHDALDFRRVLEPGAAALAATRALSAPDRAHLVACLAAIADVQLRLDRLLAAIPVLRRNLDHSDAQHERVVEAILAGDPAVARSAMEEHCDATAALLRGLLG